MRKGLSWVSDTETLLLGFLLLICARLLQEALEYGFTSGAFPRLIIGVVILLILYVLTAKAIAALRARTDKGGAVPAFTLRGLSTRVGAGFWAYLGMVLYYALIQLIGMFWATLVYSLVAPLLLGYRRMWIVVLFGVGITLAFWFGFGTFLKVPLPEGAF